MAGARTMTEQDLDRSARVLREGLPAVKAVLLDAIVERARQACRHADQARERYHRRKARAASWMPRREDTQ